MSPETSQELNTSELNVGTPVTIGGEPATITEVVTHPTPEESPAAPVVPEKLTKKQLGQLRRQYLTVVHGTVKGCEHKAKFVTSKQPPNNNCTSCWSAYFATSVDLDGIHAILTQKGVDELIKQKGKKYTRMFHGFLSSQLLPALAAETTTFAEQEAQVVGGTFGVQENKTAEV